MTIEEAVARRLAGLVGEADYLRRGDEHGSALDDDQLQKCAGWLASALNIVQILCPNETNAYRKRAEEIAARSSGWVANRDVGEFMALLQNLARDIDAGLLTSIADRARAETFDEFLEHGRAYLKEERTTIRTTIRVRHQYLPQASPPSQRMRAISPYDRSPRKNVP